MLLENFTYPQDTRVRNKAAPLAAAAILRASPADLYRMAVLDSVACCYDAAARTHSYVYLLAQGGRRFDRVALVGWARRITRWLLDTQSANSASTRWRQRRWLDLAARFPSLGDMRVLDLGGTAESWCLCPLQPAHLTLLNISKQSAVGVTP